MSILLVIQAGHDATSTRDHQMLPFGDSTVLDVALSRLQAFDGGPVVLATSDLPGDNALDEIARNREAATVRGPSDDLLARFVEVIADYPAEHLVRLRVNSPLIDHHLVSEIVQAHLSANADYTSNTLLRTHPQGLDVEVIRSDALLDAAEQANTASERAGVTTFVQRRPSEYNLHAVVATGDYEDHAWAVTDSESADRVTQLVAKSGGDLGKPWDSYLSYDRPISPDQPVRLRVARANVVAARPEFTETIGYPPEPFPLYEASRRSWGVWQGERLIGSAVVSVQNGWGTLAGSFVPGLAQGVADQTLAALDERLRADAQVIALTIDGSRIRNYQD